MKRFVNFSILVLFVLLLFYAALDLPLRGDLSAPINQPKEPDGSESASNYYIVNAYQHAHTPNMVTVILADYRGYDTMGEETVILTAGLCCFLILRARNKDEAK